MEWSWRGSRFLPLPAIGPFAIGFVEDAATACAIAGRYSPPN
jgi:hypothetical protein